MGSTLKVLSAGRYGARYGIGIRKRLLKVEGEQRKKHPCPNCGYAKVKRLQRGIFSCRKCDLKFSGGTYLPETQAGRIIRKMVSQKSFMPMVTQLTQATEETKGTGLAREILEELEHEKEAGEAKASEAGAEPPKAEGKPAKAGRASKKAPAKGESSAAPSHGVRGKPPAGDRKAKAKGKGKPKAGKKAKEQ